jgi:hypothetical protein
MGNVNDFGNSEKFNILKMMYPELFHVTPDVVAFIQDDIITLLDIDGKVIMKNTTSSLMVHGTFVIALENNTSGQRGNHITLYNLLTGKSTILYKTTYYMTAIANEFSIESVNDKFLAVKEIVTDTLKIYNKYLEETLMPRHSSFIKYKFQDYNATVTRFGYRMLFGKTCEGYVSNLTDRIEQFDSFEINDSIRLVATSYKDKEKGVAINTQSKDYFKYKLQYNGVVCGNEYEDIVKSAQLRDTDYLFCYSCNKNGLKQIGVIDIHGNELISPEYDAIDYIGADNFLIESNGYAYVFNIKKGLLTEVLPKANVYCHQVLPLCIVEESKVKCISAKGEIFYLSDIAKYFECYYCNDNKDVIKINIAGDNDKIYKYITTTLVPITNIHAIAKLETSEWTPLV